MTEKKNPLEQVFGSCSFQVGLAARAIGHGPQLVLIHGGAGSRTHWINNVADLSNSFKVITLDLPGFGESAKPPEGIASPEYVSWVAQAVRLATGKDPFHLVGFSFGGALSAAVTRLLYEQGLSPIRLTLISPSGFGKPMGRTITLEKVKKSDSTTEQEIREAAARNLGRMMLSKQPDTSDLAVDILLQNTGKVFFDSRSISHQDSLIGDLQSLDIPLQILLGERDPLIFPSLGERKALLSSALPQAIIKTIPDAGHWVQYEASSIVNHHIGQFHLKGKPYELPDNQDAQ